MKLVDDAQKSKSKTQLLADTIAADIPAGRPIRAIETRVPPTVVPTIVPRDLSINKDNAYNELFLDSLDVANFIARPDWEPIFLPNEK